MRALARSEQVEQKKELSWQQYGWCCSPFTCAATKRRTEWFIAIRKSLLILHSCQCGRHRIPANKSSDVRHNRDPRITASIMPVRTVLKFGRIRIDTNISHRFYRLQSEPLSHPRRSLGRAALCVCCPEWMHSILFSFRRLVIGFENEEQANPICEKRTRNRVCCICGAATRVQKTGWQAGNAFYCDIIINRMEKLDGKERK